MALTARTRLLAATLVAASIAPVGVVAARAPAPLARQSQGTSSARPTFEVASIKPRKADDLSPPRLGYPSGGRFGATGATLLDLITLAYGAGDSLLRRSQVVGGPDWIKNDRFDIQATSEADASGSPRRMFEMLRTLLEDRFALKAHRETRQLPIYALVLARSDGRLGPGLRRAEDCARSTTPAPRPVPGQARPCAIDGSFGVSTGRGVPLQFFVTGRLSNMLDRMVIDRSGLTGFFDWDLQWMPGPGEPTSPGDQPPPAADGPSIFTALEEQLGLKLETDRGPVEVVVIDSVDHPRPD